MKKIKCEMCGSTDLLKQDGVFVCQYCGCKYSVEEVKKMMIEGTVDVSGSTVKIDDSDELKNLYELAHRARDDNNTENAYNYYSKIILKDPQSWEANFYTTYYQSMNCTIAGILSAAINVTNCEETVFKLIKNNIKNTDEQRNAVDEVAARLILISSLLFNSYKKYYDEIPVEIRNDYVQQYADYCSAALNIVYNGGDNIVKIFGDKYGDIAAACWELGVKQHNILNGVFVEKKLHAELIKQYNEKIKKYNSSHIAPTTNMSQDGGCYIATCIYGSYDCPQVWTLRRYRDNILAQTWYGRLFVRIYYSISPTIVKWLGHTEWFKNLWKNILNSIVAKLNANGILNTPYEDRK